MSFLMLSSMRFPHSFPVTFFLSTVIDLFVFCMCILIFFYTYTVYIFHISFFEILHSLAFYILRLAREHILDDLRTETFF